MSADIHRIANPHFAKPAYVRAAFRLRALWVHAPLFKATVVGLSLAGPFWLLLVLLAAF